VFDNVVVVFSVPCLRRARRSYGRTVNDCPQTTGEITSIHISPIKYSLLLRYVDCQSLLRLRIVCMEKNIIQVSFSVLLNRYIYRENQKKIHQLENYDMSEMREYIIFH